MNISSYLKKLPEFSDSNFVKASYICGGVLSGIVVFFIIEMFSADDFGIDIEWNIFESAWFGILFPIGFVLAIVNWGKFGHWSMQSYYVYKDDWGRKYTKKNNDIIDTMFNSIIWPLVGHFLIEPTIYVCIIYYPLMCIFALLDVFLPYVISLTLIALSAGVLFSSRYFIQMRYRSLVVVCITVLVGGGLLWASIEMNQSRNPQIEISQSFNQLSDDEMFGEQGIKEQTEQKSVVIDEMFEDVD
jgi:hypothetical protein